MLRILVGLCRESAALLVDVRRMLLQQGHEAPEVDALLQAVRVAAEVPDPGVSGQSVDEEAGDRFRIIYGDEIESLPAPEWLIEDLLVKGSLAVLYGAAGVGKSFVALAMAGCISAGIPFLGKGVSKGTCLYVAAEGVGDLGLRMGAFRGAYGLDSLPSMRYVIEPVNLFLLADVRALVEQMIDAPPDLIVIDTLARSMAGGDENSAKDMAMVIRAADYLRTQLGATVLIVHHSGHDASRERGSSAIKGAVDTQIKVHKSTGRLTLSCDKQKTAPVFDPIPVVLEPHAESLALVSADLAAITEEHLLVTARLVSADGVTHSDWKASFLSQKMGSASTFERHRRALEDQGLLTKHREQKGTLYHLTEVGRQAIGVKGAT